MLVPDPTYTFAHVAPPASYELGSSAHALLLVTGEHDTREELVWVQVVECLQDSTHRAQVLWATSSFPELPAGQIVHFRPEHVLQVRLPNGHCLTGVSGAMLA
ncbi:hypothetical protein [Deinococcus aquatilis]|uniref:hypothetical protein n=1 Tax=Deinococcus aquatilis TaxID=519440 RepID=UPI00037AF215|nr:hypothetical protein [Deinococcus aquatilis]